MLSRAKCQVPYWISTVEVLLLQAVAAKFRVYFRARDTELAHVTTYYCTAPSLRPTVDIHFLHHVSFS